MKNVLCTLILLICLPIFGQINTTKTRNIAAFQNGLEETVTQPNNDESILERNGDVFYTRVYDSLKLRVKEYEKFLTRAISGTTDVSKLDRFKVELKKNSDSLLKIDKRIFEADNRKPEFKGFFFALNSSKKKELFERVYSQDNRENFYFITQSGLQFSDQGGTIQSDLATAYLGDVRINLGASISNTSSNSSGGDNNMNSENTSETESFQRLLAGGGNTYLSAELPIGLFQNKRWFVYSNIIGRVSLDIAELSGDVDTSTGNGSFITNFVASVSTDNNEFDFFINADAGFYWGSSSFYQRLKLEDSKAFYFGKVSLGVTIFDNIRLTATVRTFGSDTNLDSERIVIGTQILSDFFKSKKKS